MRLSGFTMFDDLSSKEVLCRLELFSTPLWSAFPLTAGHILISGLLSYILGGWDDSAGILVAVTSFRRARKRLSKANVAVISSPSPLRSPALLLATQQSVLRPILQRQLSL